MASAWTPPTVLHGVTLPPGLNTPRVNALRIAIVRLAGSNAGVFAQSGVDRRLPLEATDSAPGTVADVVPLGGATMPRTMMSYRLMACTSYPVRKRLKLRTGYAQSVQRVTCAICG